MRLPEGAAENLVPRRDPPGEAVPAALYDQAARLEDELEARAVLWAAAINAAALQYGLPRCGHLSAGFVYIPPELQDGVAAMDVPLWEGFTFGGYALVRPAHPFEPADARVETLRLGDSAIPLLVLAGRVELHRRPPDPFDGTGACWIRNSGRNRSWKYGILTCRHVVEHLPLGSPVPIFPNGDYAHTEYARLADMDECTLDAAVLEVDPDLFPPNTSLLPVPPVAPKRRVRMRGRHTRTHGTVLRVFQHPPYFGTLFGQRFVIDCSGEHGDSGALIEPLQTSGALGLYMGRIPDGRGGWDGMVQDMAQVARYFTFEPYH